MNQRRNNNQYLELIKILNIKIYATSKILMSLIWYLEEINNSKKEK